MGGSPSLERFGTTPCSLSHPHDVAGCFGWFPPARGHCFLSTLHAGACCSHAGSKHITGVCTAVAEGGPAPLGGQGMEQTWQQVPLRGWSPRPLGLWRNWVGFTCTSAVYGKLVSCSVISQWSPATVHIMRGRHRHAHTASGASRMVLALVPGVRGWNW